MTNAGPTKGSCSVSVSVSASASASASAGATVRTVSDKSMKDEDVDSSPYHEGERVLAYHGPCIYEAKIQTVEFHKDEWRYFVHYHGWNKHWDEWLSPDHLLKRTEENIQKHMELKEKHIKPGRPSQDKPKTSVVPGVRGRKRKHEIIEKESSITHVEKLNIQISSALKKQLVDDHECITHLNKLVNLPRTPCVREILKKYLDLHINKDSMIGDSVVEVVDGLCCYFDKALPAMLLYKQERQQYREAITEDVSPCDIYGGEHLLRLFVKLPELLSCMHIAKEALQELQQRLQDILRFLQSNQTAFFHLNYQKSEDAGQAIKQEDNNN